MSILSYFKGLFSVETPTYEVTSYDATTGESIDEQDALALSSVYACTRLLAGSEANLPVNVVRPGSSSGTSEIAFDHWAHRLLHYSPAAEWTPFDFFEMAGASLELKGNALARKEMSGDRVIALEPMSWDETRAWRNSDGHLRYDYRGDTFTDREVLHIRGFGRDRQNLGGISTIAIAASTFGLAKAINKSAGAIFKNGIRTNIALMAERDLTEEQMETARGKVEERYGRSANSGKPLLLNNGWKAEALSINPEDAQMLESRSFSVEDICRFFGVPPFMIGHTEKTTSWGSGVEQAVLGYQKFTLGPRLRRIEQTLAKQLLSPADLAAGLKIEFNLEGLLRGDSEGRASFYQKMSQIGAMTINEIRAKENLAPVPGGEVPRMQMQNVPITQAGEEPQI